MQGSHCTITKHRILNCIKQELCADRSQRAGLNRSQTTNTLWFGFGSRIYMRLQRSPVNAITPARATSESRPMDVCVEGQNVETAYTALEIWGDRM